MGLNANERLDLDAVLLKSLRNGLGLQYGLDMFWMEMVLHMVSTNQLLIVGEAFPNGFDIVWRSHLTIGA